MPSSGYLSFASFATRVASCVYLFADRRRCGCALCIGNPWAPPLGHRIFGRARIVGIDGRFKSAFPGEVAGRHGARPAPNSEWSRGQSRACCCRSGAAIIRRRSQSAGRTLPRTRGEPGHSADFRSAAHRVPLQYRRQTIPPSAQLRFRCPRRRRRTNQLRPRPRHCSPDPVQKGGLSNAGPEKRAQKTSRPATIVATSPGIIIRGVIILPIIGTLAERRE